MADYDPGRPTTHEHMPYWGQYIALVPEGNVIEFMATQINATVDFLLTFSLDGATRPPEPGEWSPIEIVGHLADTERVLAYRLLRIARADPVLWESIEFEEYVKHADFENRVMADVAEEFADVRTATLALLRGLGERAWSRRMPDDWAVRSVRSLAYVLAGHELHHLADLKGDRYRGDAGVGDA